MKINKSYNMNWKKNILATLITVSIALFFYGLNYFVNNASEAQMLFVANIIGWIAVVVFVVFVWVIIRSFLD